jgi:hypothetical protein
MWQYNNVRFIYSNPVDSIFNQEKVIPKLLTYIKSKYALTEALRMHVESSNLGAYTEIDIRTIKYDKPFKI